MVVHDSAEDLKVQGNRYFQTQRYKEALDAYSKAIVKNPQIATFYTNRALCYIQTKSWESAVRDCQKAIELDKKSVKAYYFWGRAAIHLEQYDDAVKLLVKANDLATACKQVNFGDEITSQLRLARREKFRKEEDKRVQQEIDLVSYLDRLIDEDIARRAEDTGADAGDRLKMDHESLGYKTQLNAILAQVDDRRRHRELPDYLCGKISFELMRDPVITPSGITYDRGDIRQHLQRVGHFDPVTRAPLSEDQLIPNLAMKEVVEAFLIDNPWAEHDDPNI